MISTTNSKTILSVLCLSLLTNPLHAASIRHHNRSPEEAIVCTTCVHGTRQGDPCLGTCVCNDKWEGKDCNTCAGTFIGDRCQYSDATTCSDHGTVDDAGSCACHHGWAGDFCSECAQGFKGVSCKFSDLETCHGHGTVDEVGACICAGNWANEPGAEVEGNWIVTDCSHCKPAFKGADCEFSRAVTCHDHGQVSESGVCSCDSHYGGGAAGATDKDPMCEKCTPPWVGSKCQFSDVHDCHGHGSVAFDGACQCVTRWGGESCEKCAEGYAGIDLDCKFSDIKDCSAHGLVNEDGTCTCDSNTKWRGRACDQCRAPWKGGVCQYSDAKDCSNHGAVSSIDGTCSCRYFWLGAKCDLCPSGFKGDDCQYSDARDCSRHGEVDQNGACTCRNFWSGDRCQYCTKGAAGKDCEYSDRMDCNDHGVVHGSDGSCTCRNDWSGKHCNVCPSGHAGVDCQYSDKVDCNNNGAVLVDARCSCLENWSGNKVCTKCSKGHVGDHCQYSRKETCYEHGTPIGTSQNFPSLCKCDVGFWGVHCQHSEREFLNNCVASPTRSPERCCGVQRWTKWSLEEENRISRSDSEVRRKVLASSVCDNIWGVWRSEELTLLTGVPRVSEIKTKNGDWVGKESGSSGAMEYNFYDL